MKNFKLIFAALLLMLGTIGVFAFTGSMENQTKFWYEYDGSGLESDPSNYSLAGGTGEEPACEQGINLCAVLAEPSANPNQPDLATVDHKLDKFKN